jgi:hypothetical protein
LINLKKINCSKKSLFEQLKSQGISDNPFSDTYTKPNKNSKGIINQNKQSYQLKKGKVMEDDSSIFKKISSQFSQGWKLLI